MMPMTIADTTPLPSSPARGEVPPGGRGWIVPQARSSTLPLVGKDGEGVAPLGAFQVRHG